MRYRVCDFLVLNEKRQALKVEVAAAGATVVAVKGSVEEIQSNFSPGGKSIGRQTRGGCSRRNSCVFALKGSLEERRYRVIFPPEKKSTGRQTRGGCSGCNSCCT